MSGVFEASLRDVGDKLLGTLGEKDGLGEEQLVAAEQRLGVRFPTTLRLYYRIAGGNAVVRSAHNRLIDPTSLAVENGGLVFIEENQNVMFYGIMTKHLGDGNKPVQQGNPNEDTWYPEADFLSAFLLGETCWQVALGLPRSGCGVLDEQLMNDLRNQLTYAHPGADDGTVDLLGFYEQGLVVSVSRSAKKIMVGTTSDEGLRRFEERFGTGLDHL